jgi:hypothetical protein
LVSDIKGVLAKSVDDTSVLCLVNFLVGAVIEVKSLFNLVGIGLHVSLCEAKAVPANKNEKAGALTVL